MCRAGYQIPRRTKGVIRSSQRRRPSLVLLNKIHQDSVSLSEYITFAKITGEREISLQAVTPAFRAIWEEVQTLTTDGVSDDGLFCSLSHPFTYQSLRSSLCSRAALHTHYTLCNYLTFIVIFIEEERCIFFFFLTPFGLFKITLQESPLKFRVIFLKLLILMCKEMQTRTEASFSTRQAPSVLSENSEQGSVAGGMKRWS